jgi:hypothetical protein
MLKPEWSICGKHCVENSKERTWDVDSPVSGLMMQQHRIFDGWQLMLRKLEKAELLMIINGESINPPALTRLYNAVNLAY